jgi:hypothetical protein
MSLMVSILHCLVSRVHWTCLCKVSPEVTNRMTVVLCRFQRQLRSFQPVVMRDAAAYCLLTGLLLGRTLDAYAPMDRSQTAGRPGFNVVTSDCRVHRRPCRSMVRLTGPDRVSADGGWRQPVLRHQSLCVTR